MTSLDYPIMKIDGLPEGSEMYGILYANPHHEYVVGDVFEVTLPTGFTVDVGWDEDEPEQPFRLVVYKGYFGNQIVDYRVATPDEVVVEVRKLADRYSGV